MKTKQTHKNKKAFVFLALPIILAVFFVLSLNAKAACREGVMLYEIYGGGGNTGALYKNDFIGLYNNSNSEINLDGWSVQYAASSSGDFAITELNGSIEAGGYYLIEEKSGSSGELDLPGPDVKGNLSLAADKGKVALVRDNVKILNEDAISVVDLVSYTGASNTKSVFRKNDACLDSDVYGADFGVHEPAPKNSNFLKEEEDDNEEEEDDLDETVVCEGDPGQIILNEIYPNPENEEEEFVELFNAGEACVDISGWAIKDSTDTESHKTSFGVGTVLEAGDFFSVEKNLFLNNDDDTVFLLDKNGAEMDKRAYEKSERGSAYALFGSEWRWTIVPTKGEENILEEAKEELDEEEDYQKNFSSEISITELFPNPFKTHYEEYVELHNESAKDVDLRGWTLRDASKKGKHTFTESLVLRAQSYLAIFKKDFKFALNNSGAEKVALFDPDEKEISSVAYNGSKKNVSYNFDGTRWRWSKFLTPGAENKFEKEPTGKIKIDKDIYEDVFANFAVLKLSKKAKVTWNFGDGRKSYLQTTRHKYAKTGKYLVKVKFSEGNEEVLKEFEISVKKLPHPEVKIVGFKANPVGNDTLGETVLLENKSKKKIDLVGWSIATGDKTLANHPITEKLVLKSKEKREITKEISKFVLNNKKGKIELRYPDGKVADKVRYDHGKTSIGEDEEYVKTKNGWSWTPVKADKVSPPTSEFNGVNQQEPENNKQEKEPIPEVAGIEIVKRENKILKQTDLVEIEILKNAPQVFKLKDLREETNLYFFTSQNKQRHYAKVFLEKIFLNINMTLNLTLNSLFE